MTPNFTILALCSFIPFLVATIWYHSSLFGGDTWNKLVGLTDQQSKTKIKPVKLIISILLNFIIALGLAQITLHQMGVFSLVGGNAEALKIGTGAAFLAEYGKNHLDFGHGFFHGILAAILFVLPVLGYATIFERKSAKYLLVNFGFWTISLALMGGVIAAWGGVPIV
ncbi:MAG: hypothetical protein COA58_14085 [Bacteroidetes bacterium]|nr:MAG: hypothetical protein COA58_14085 [Bacteroidota bacterium]